MARILTSLPGSTWSEDFSVGRTAKDDRGITKTAHQIVAQRLTQQVQDNIESKGLVESGTMKDTSVVRYVGGANKRMEYSAVVHAGYQDKGTKHIAPNNFVGEVMRSGRADWEADVRATIKTLEKRAEAAEKKERGRGRER